MSLVGKKAPIFSAPAVINGDEIVESFSLDQYIGKKEVVFIRRKFEPYKGWLALPGGFVEIGETVEQSCVREIKEETGLDICINDLELVGVYSENLRDPRGHTVSIAFKCETGFNNLTAGDDALSVEVIDDWEKLDIAFDHKRILEDTFFHKKGKDN